MFKTITYTFKNNRLKLIIVDLKFVMLNVLKMEKTHAGYAVIVT